jgi:hypothetical protein
VPAACVRVNNALHLALLSAVRTHIRRVVQRVTPEKQLSAEQGVCSLAVIDTSLACTSARQTNITLLSQYYQLFVLFDLERRGAHYLN